MNVTLGKNTCSFIFPLSNSFQDFSRCYCVISGYLIRIGVRFPAWTRSCAACCRRPCFSRGVGLDDPQRSLPTPNILWFCDSVLSAVDVSQEGAQHLFNFALETNRLAFAFFYCESSEYPTRQ